MAGVNTGVGGYDRTGALGAVAAGALNVELDERGVEVGAAGVTAGGDDWRKDRPGSDRAVGALPVAVRGSERGATETFGRVVAPELVA